MANPKAKPRTAAQRSALAKNLRAGREANAARLKATPKSERPKKTRHQQLLDGEITVKDLDDEELRRGRGRDRIGGFHGRPPTLTSKLVKQITTERMRRAQGNMEAHVVAATEALADIVINGEKDSDRIKAALILIERNMGKVPDVVRVGVEDPWDAILKEALGVEEIDPDLSAALRSPRAGQSR